MARKSSAVRASFGATISTPASRSSSNSIMTISFEGPLPRDRGASMRVDRRALASRHPMAPYRPRPSVGALDRKRRARLSWRAASAGHGAVECGLGPIDLALRAPAGARRAVAAEGRVALRDLEARKLLLHLRFAPGERRQALLEPGGLLLRLGLDGLQPLCLSFELELAGHRRFGQIVPALAKRKSRLLIETGEPLAGQAFLAHGLRRRAVAASCSERTSSIARSTSRIASRITLVPPARSMASTESSMLPEIKRRTRKKIDSAIVSPSCLRRVLGTTKPFRP